MELHQREASSISTYRHNEARVCAIMLLSPMEDKDVASIDILSIWRMRMPACMLNAISHDFFGHDSVSPLPLGEG